MKKLISLMLVVCMATGISMPVFASEAQTDTASEYTAIGDGQTIVYTYGHCDKRENAPELVQGKTRIMYGGNWYSYRINFLNPGVYKVGIRNTMYREGGTGTLLINGQEVGRGAFEHNTSAHTTDFCEISTDAGECIFTYQNGEVSVDSFSYFVFTYLGDEHEYTKDADDFCDTEGDVTSPSAGMASGSSVDYAFTLPDGVFRIFADVESDSDNSTITAYVDGMEAGGADFDDFVGEVSLGYTELTCGSHTVTLANTGDGSINLNSLRLVYVYADKTLSQQFADELNLAGSRTELDRLLREGSGKYILDYTDYLDDIFDKSLIYSKLLRFDYSSLAVFDSLFLKTYREEMRNPFVTAVQNGAAVTTPVPGDLTLKVNPKLPLGAEVIAAVYNEDYTHLKCTDGGTLSTYEPLELTGLKIEAASDKVRLFYLENTKNLRPMGMLIGESTIFVSPEGNDSSSGLSPDEPLFSLHKAVELAGRLNSEYPRNITVSLAGGEYVLNETLLIDEDISGSEDCYLHFESESVSNPAVISGGMDVEGWEPYRNGIYKAQLPQKITDVRQLYINEYPAQRARSSDYYFGEDAWDNTEDDYYSEDGFFVNANAFPVLDKPGNTELAYLNKWTLQRLPVEDVVYNYQGAGKTLVRMQQPYYGTAITMKCSGDAHPARGTRFHIENDLTLLDEKGEFYFDKDTKYIYYMPFDEEDLTDESTRAVIAKTEKLLSVIGSAESRKVKNVTFRNISFRYGGYYTEINQEGAVSFQADNLVDADSGLNQNPVLTGVGRTLETQITVENASGIEFNACDIACMGSTALRMGSGAADSAVSGCIFTDIGGGAVSVGTWEDARPLAQRINVQNNIITRTGLDFMSSPAVTVYYAKNVNVLHNTIANISYSGISVGWGWAYQFNTKAVPVYEKDDSGNYILDDNGDKIPVYVTNTDGSYKLDAEGNKIAETETVPDTESPSKSNRLGVGHHNISYNRIHDIANATKDGGHIYNLGYMKETHVTNNYLTDSPDYGGVYLDTGASNIRITENVFEDCAKNNIAFGGHKWVVGNLAQNNWADKAQSSSASWKGDNCIFYEPVVIEDDSWPDDARTVMQNAGVEDEYKDGLERLSKPSWRTIEHYSLPDTEALDENTIYVPSETYEASYSYTVSKTEPKLFYYSGIVAIGNYNQSDWVQYEVNVPKTGKYTLALDLNTTSDTCKVHVFLDKERLGKEYDRWSQYTEAMKNKAKFRDYSLPKTALPDDSYVPHVFRDSDGNEKLLDLEEGTYYLRMVNIKSGFSFMRFRLKLVSEEK